MKTFLEGRDNLAWENENSYTDRTPTLEQNAQLLVIVPKRATDDLRYYAKLEDKTRLKDAVNHTPWVNKPLAHRTLWHSRVCSDHKSLHVLRTETQKGKNQAKKLTSSIKAIKAALDTIALLNWM